MCRCVFIALTAFLLPSVLAVASSAQTAEDIAALDREYSKLNRAGRFVDALPVYERYAEAVKAVHGQDSLQYAIAINNWAELLRINNRYPEALEMMRRALAQITTLKGPEHPDVGVVQSNLAALLHALNQSNEAERLMRLSLANHEKAYGPEHPQVAVGLNNLAQMLADTNRYDVAEPLMRRALAIDEKSFAADHPRIATRLRNLAALLSATDRLADAERLSRRSLEIAEKNYGLDDSRTTPALTNLARILKARHNYPDAEEIMRRALTNEEKAFGREHMSVARRLVELADLMAEGAAWRIDAAEALTHRAIDIYEKSYGLDHPSLARPLATLARLLARRGDFGGAAAVGRRAIPVVISARETGGESHQESTEVLIKDNTAALRSYAYYIFRDSPHDDAALDEGFRIAQWALQTSAANAVRQMSVRFAKGDDQLGRLVRERQDLVANQTSVDKRLLMAVARADVAEVETLRTSIAALGAELDAIDGKLAVEFRDFADLARPTPVGISQLQPNLRRDETLVLFLDVMEGSESLYWIVTRQSAHWGTMPISSWALVDEVQALRCGLDESHWQAEWSIARCRRLLKREPAAGVLPFDLGRAHKLYRTLFGAIEHQIKTEHLLIVLPESLSTIPFSALVTKDTGAFSSDAADYSRAAWLAKNHAVTVLPSVSNLNSLRQHAKASAATRPFLGFGNPLLSGPDGTDRRSWERQSCQSTTGSSPTPKRAVGKPSSRFFRGGLADVEEVRAQHPLPETADEICRVAQAVGAGVETIYLGEKATEKNLKALSTNGTLADARIVHFATHGLLAGETEMLSSLRAEPALILTPPQTASEEDDGLLTASEIAQLRLDADWVVLSACNTAAGENTKPGGEALSGLARAFFYAGARALLVSHWAVNSQATVELITKAFAELKADPKIGRAEAMRRSMLGLIGKGGPYAHPSNWAPFVVVGEGAR